MGHQLKGCRGHSPHPANLSADLPLGGGRVRPSVRPPAGPLEGGKSCPASGRVTGSPEGGWGGLAGAGSGVGGQLRPPRHLLGAPGQGGSRGWASLGPAPVCRRTEPGYRAVVGWPSARGARRGSRSPPGTRSGWVAQRTLQGGERESGAPLARLRPSWGVAAQDR